MAEYIEREAVMKHLRECEGTPPEIGYTYPIYKAIERFVKEVPTADVAPVVHGYWTVLDECANAGAYCSVCHKKVYKECYGNCKMKSKYCPNCGAKMEG
jgi:hypothetical protein